MRVRLSTGLVLSILLLVAAPAAAHNGLHARKDAIDSRIDSLQGKIDAARAKEGVLTSQISAVTAKIRALDDDVSNASARLDQLERVLVLHQRRLDRLNDLYRLQTRRLVFLQRQHRAATERLNRRLIEIYTSEATSPLTVVLEAASFADLLDQLEYVNEIGSQDERITQQVETAKVEMQATRNATRKTRAEVAATTQAVADRTAEQRAVRDRLAWSQRQLATARRDKREALASVQQTKEEYLAVVNGLLAQSSALAARIQAAQRSAAAVSTTRAPSSSGFIWPVNGPLTSPFGPRWGRMHEGIDIAVPTGTPVVASAAGTVIVSGWMGGYGNLVVVDHGNGISTAYAHNSALASGVGQPVAQGQLIAYAGNTGHSFGSHVHFEVRVNGSPVDPLGYL